MFTASDKKFSNKHIKTEFSHISLSLAREKIPVWLDQLSPIGKPKSKC